MTQAFNLSQLANNVNTSGLLNAAAGLYNQVPVANGGTGRSTTTSGTLLLGAGTSAMTELTGGTVGNVVTWNGSAWGSAAGAGGAAPIVNVYASPSAWLKPATLKAVKVTVIGGGGGGSGGRAAPSGKGGGGGTAISYILAPALPASPISVTVGTGGAGGTAPATVGVTTPGTAGNTSSFGPFISATGGGAGTTLPGAGGTGTGNIAFPGGKANDVGNGGDFNGTFFSIPNQGLNTPNAAGRAGNGYGGGGTGSFTLPSPTAINSQAGGTGATGIVVVEEFY